MYISDVMLHNFLGNSNGILLIIIIIVIAVMIIFCCGKMCFLFCCICVRKEWHSQDKSKYVHISHNYIYVTGC